ncbi:acyl-CoA thioesterase II [Rhodomicrobium vannielii ATCC 17100]|jgi:acyl-CoA thioesterase II|uniref:Acyl-CoA thioesterase 2 n=1 Tax=Rhodomicrobium vannielii (strain ATCC 17100 / DSM 162 / LMG 4299 / NCIMB 10020 / ATH 3.1.1) TaxID=648757 RepID=E3I5S2_RHOVT|nr:acyl-CoA thioesterase II [Rhodomicrobium vannielii]ADP69425.1 acyl-CoA thioesterase II [Rhodomicrobium vannielii ATCC 17100]
MPAVDQLLSILDLEQLEHNLFRGRSPQNGWQRVFGGQVVGQALTAAYRTVEDQDRVAHSLHAYFLLGGDPKVPIIYHVDRMRDGGSFTTRRVTAIQHGRPIYTMAVSFHALESGFDHQIEMPKVAQPEELPSEEELKARLLPILPEVMRLYWERDRPIELRPVDLSRFFCKEKLEPKQYIWFRANGSLPDNFRLHQCVLAYASDFSLLDTALVAHGRSLFEPELMLASLDHSVWFHRPFKADEWLLYAMDSPSAQAARGFCRGSIFSRDGTLVASVAQEGMIREKAAK